MERPLQRRISDRADEHAAMAPPLEGELLNLREFPELRRVAENDDLQLLKQYFAILWSHRWALAGTLLLGGAVSLAIALFAIPQYRARASVEIQNVQEIFSNPVVSSNQAVATQGQLLASMAIRDRASAKVIGRANTQSVDVTGALATVRRALRLPDRGQSISWNEAVKMAASALTVSAPKEGNVIFIQTDSPNPRVSADFINMLAEEYLASVQEERWQAYHNTGSWLTRAQEDLKKKLEASEQRLAEFAKAKGLLFTSGNDNASEDKFKQLQTALLSASNERISKQAAYEASLGSPTEALPSVLDSGPMATYQVKLAELRRELAELSTTLTPAHYKSQQVEAQIEQIEKEAAKERSNIIRRIRIEYDAAVKRESQLRHDFEKQTELLSYQSNDTIQYSILLHEVETNRKLYDSTLAQDKEASLALAMRTSGARVVDAAFTPRSPIKPGLPIYLSLGMMGGLLCGAMFIVVRVRSDMRIQAPGAVECELNLRELGVIPAASTDPGMRLLRDRSSARAPGVSGKVAGIVTSLRNDQSSSNHVALATQNVKLSAIAESFRSLMTSIIYAGPGTPRPQVLVVTSASPREGKSTVVSNLGIAFAEIGNRVLLIDADMRLPRLHQIFDIPNTFGLSDVLHEIRPVQEYPEESLVRHTKIAGLDVLPAGPARATLPRLLHSDRVHELFSLFRGTYDTILVDTPPVLSVPDARSMSRAADAVLLVVRAHLTEQDAIFAAVRCFVEDGSRVLGTILNCWNPKISSYGPYHFYGGYYPRSLYGKYSS